MLQGGLLDKPGSMQCLMAVWRLREQMECLLREPHSPFSRGQVVLTHLAVDAVVVLEGVRAALGPPAPALPSALAALALVFLHALLLDGLLQGALAFWSPPRPRAAPSSLGPGPPLRRALVLP